MTSSGATAPIAIVNGTVLGGPSSRASNPKSNLVFDGSTIVDHSQGLGREESLPGREIDASGLSVAPGFIDLQINGGYGFDFADTPETMWSLGPHLARHGVTAFLPTIISSPLDVYPAAIKAWSARPARYRGPEPVGLHFEGPMLSDQRPGAHRPRYLRQPDLALAAGWARGNGVRMVTLAPELIGVEDVISVLVEQGVTVSAGHTTATAAQAGAAADIGVTSVTHLFNAMRPLEHRAPGLVGAALTDDRLSVGLIVDGIHVDPQVIKLVWRAKGPDKVLLVTDSVAAMGLGPGRYQFGDFAVTADENSVRTSDGTLAGSILTMDQAVRNTVQFTEADHPDVIAAATVNPARVIGLVDRGSLTTGSKADVVLLDHDLNVVMTICSGQAAYVSTEAEDRIGPGLASWVEPLNLSPTDAE